MIAKQPPLVVPASYSRDDPDKVRPFPPPPDWLPFSQRVLPDIRALVEAEYREQNHSIRDDPSIRDLSSEPLSVMIGANTWLMHDPGDEECHLYATIDGLNPTLVLMHSRHVSVPDLYDETRLVTLTYLNQWVRALTGYTLGITYRRALVLLGNDGCATPYPPGSRIPYKNR